MLAACNRCPKVLDLADLQLWGGATVQGPRGSLRREPRVRLCPECGEAEAERLRSYWRSRGWLKPQTIDSGITSLDQVFGVR